MTCPRCNQPIADHTAGRELDACVAEVVMGWTWVDGRGTGGPSYWDGQGAIPCFEPSTDHNDAWQVDKDGWKEFV